MADRRRRGAVSGPGVRGVHPFRISDRRACGAGTPNRPDRRLARRQRSDLGPRRRDLSPPDPVTQLRYAAGCSSRSPLSFIYRRSVAARSSAARETIDSRCVAEPDTRPVPRADGEVLVASVPDSVHEPASDQSVLLSDDPRSISASRRRSWRTPASALFPLSPISSTTRDLRAPSSALWRDRLDADCPPRGRSARRGRPPRDHDARRGERSGRDERRRARRPPRDRVRRGRDPADRGVRLRRVPRGRRRPHGGGERLRPDPRRVELLRRQRREPDRAGNREPRGGDDGLLHEVRRSGGRLQPDRKPVQTAGASWPRTSACPAIW